MIKQRRVILGIMLSAMTLFGPPVNAQESSCKPVVYVFRHAEDYNPGRQSPPYGFLTYIGEKHASLYPAMVSHLRSQEGHCAVTRVYATNPFKGKTPDDNWDGSTNAFCTARPLARITTGQEHKIAPAVAVENNETPILMCRTMSEQGITVVDPIIFLHGSGVWEELDEFLGADNFVSNGPAPDSTVAELLRDTLTATAKDGGSSAIFWTSDGLYALGTAILNSASKTIPQKTKNVNPENIANWTYTTMLYDTPPRNAAYLFTYDNVAESFAELNPNDKKQCYNFISGADEVTGFKEQLINYFWCGDDDLGGKTPEDCDDTVGSYQNGKCGLIPEVCLGDGKKGCIEKINGHICQPNSTSCEVPEG